MDRTLSSAMDRIRRKHHTEAMRTLDKLQEALKRMKNRKAAGPDNINIELLKYGGLPSELRILLSECWEQRKYQRMENGGSNITI